MKWVGIPLLMLCSKMALCVDINSDVYVVLYTRRVQAVQAMKDRHLAQLAFDQTQMDMMRRLRASGAASMEEYRSAETKVLISSARIREVDVLVLEAEAMLDIAKARRTTGLEMPICPTIVQ